MKHYSKFTSACISDSTSSSAKEEQGLQKKTDKIHNSSVPMNIEKELSHIRQFIQTGLVVVTVMIISAVSIMYGQKQLAENVTAVSGQAGNEERKLPIYCVDTKEKKVALSFDAAWGNEDTKEILSILKKNKVHVTFFMTGGWIEKYPEDVKAIAKAGHELGNHSENHKQMSTLSKEQCKEEIDKPHDKVKKIAKVDMKVFRPPYGDYNNTLIEAGQECGYHTIQWDVDILVM